jgi:Golgi nucleoside diphosphatase
MISISDLHWEGAGHFPRPTTVHDVFIFESKQLLLQTVCSNFTDYLHLISIQKMEMVCNICCSFFGVFKHIFGVTAFISKLNINSLLS